MNEVLLAALIAGLAGYLWVPHPAAGLGRVRTTRGQPRRTRPGDSPPLRVRALVGLGSAMLALLLIPDVAGLLTGFLLGVVGWIGTGLIRRPVNTREAARQLPDALEFLAATLDAGRPMASAVEAVAAVSRAPTGETLAGVSARLALGQTPAEAWRELSDDPVWSRVAVDVARAERTGTALADLLRIHAEDARREARDAALQSARKVGVRSVMPLMACFLPAFILVGVVPIVAGLLKGFFG